MNALADSSIFNLRLILHVFCFMSRETFTLREGNNNSLFWLTFTLQWSDCQCVLKSSLDLKKFATLPGERAHWTVTFASILKLFEHFEFLRNTVMPCALKPCCKKVCPQMTNAMGKGLKRNIFSRRIESSNHPDRLRASLMTIRG